MRRPPSAVGPSWPQWTWTSRWCCLVVGRIRAACSTCQSDERWPSNTQPASGSPARAEALYRGGSVAPLLCPHTWRGPSVIETFEPAVWFRFGSPLLPIPCSFARLLTAQLQRLCSVASTIRTRLRRRSLSCSPCLVQHIPSVPTQIEHRRGTAPGEVPWPCQPTAPYPHYCDALQCNARRSRDRACSRALLEASNSQQDDYPWT